MNDEKIIKLYSEENKSTYEIAEIMKTYPNKIRRILIKNKIRLKDKSEAQKNALKTGKSIIPTQGKQRTKEEKIKISKSLQERWNNISEEEYQERVAGAKKRWQKLSQAEKQSMQKSAIEAIQKAGKEGSKLEKHLINFLRESGNKVESHKKNLIPNESLEIDIYLPELKTIIEVDGPSHFLPIWGDEKLQKQIKSDSNKTGLILSKGFVIIRIKHMSNSISLVNRENLKNNLIDLLNNISDNFPKESERYIEVEA